MKALYLALILTIPTIDVADYIQQSIEETGVYMGVYYGCYNSDDDGLVCILPPDSDNEEEKANENRDYSALPKY